MLLGHKETRPHIRVILNQLVPSSWRITEYGLKYTGSPAEGEWSVGLYEVFDRNSIAFCSERMIPFKLNAGGQSGVVMVL